jgi:hypothetical protein
MSDTLSDSTVLDVNQAAAAFAQAFEPPKEEEIKVDTEIEPQATEPPVEPIKADETPTDEEIKTVPVVVNGKTIEVPLSEVLASYQKDKAASEKFEAAASLRKTADAEIVKAQQERATYAATLEKIGTQLEVALENDKAVKWDELLQNDPVEYLKQQRLAQERQAQLHQVNQHRAALAQQQQAERQEAYKAYVQSQSQELLAKLPAWKDEAKAKAERESLKTYLKKEGYDDESLNGITDHRAVILARKAMLYDQMLEKASAATKKVVNLPAKVERPGVSDSNPLDKRSVAYSRLSKSGKVEDAAALFSSIL